MEFQWALIGCRIAREQGLLDSKHFYWPPLYSRAQAHHVLGHHSIACVYILLHCCISPMAENSTVFNPLRPCCRSMFTGRSSSRPAKTHEAGGVHCTVCVCVYYVYICVSYACESIGLEFNDLKKEHQHLLCFCWLLFRIEK